MLSQLFLALPFKHYDIQWEDPATHSLVRHNLHIIWCNEDRGKCSASTLDVFLVLLTVMDGKLAASGTSALAR